jgi:hypothetical protein
LIKGSFRETANFYHLLISQMIRKRNELAALSHMKAARFALGLTFLATDYPNLRTDGNIAALPSGFMIFGGFGFVTS